MDEEVYVKCKTCQYYNFYQMITDGPYSYLGKIPCLTCIHLSDKVDNYEPIGANDTEDGCDNLMLKCNCVEHKPFNNATAWICLIHGCQAQID